MGWSRESIAWHCLAAISLLGSRGCGGVANQAIYDAMDSLIRISDFVLRKEMALTLEEKANDEG